MRKPQSKKLMFAVAASMGLSFALGCEATPVDQDESEIAIAEANLHGRFQQMDLIVSDAHAALCGFDYSNATETVSVFNLPGGRSAVRLDMRNGPPNRLITTWVKLDGTSPITGAGATPLARTSLIDDLAEATPPSAGSPAPRGNGFYTDHNGNGGKTFIVDFRLSGDYPFSTYDPTLPDVAVGDTPFTLRSITHCVDELGHGLVPGVHEPTFQISL